MRAGGNGREATQFYLENREAMDVGAKAAWAERFNPDEVSAIQNCMNLKIDKPQSFDAEYQNDPIKLSLGDDLPTLERDVLITKVNGLPRGVVPRECNRLAAFIDVGQVCWFGVVALDDQYGGSLIDYGAWPEQNRAYFAASDARPKLADIHPGLPETTQIYKGVISAVDMICKREYEIETGGYLKAERVGIDSGWQAETIYKASRESIHSSLLVPTKGHATRPGATALRDWARRPGEQVGKDWRLSLVNDDQGRRARLCIFDTNEWKTFAVERLLTKQGSFGSISLFGKHRETYIHQLLVDHLCAEYRTRKLANGRTTDEWKIKPTVVDNHLWDVFVGCMLVANLSGLNWQAGAFGEQASDIKQNPLKRIHGSNTNSSNLNSVASLVTDSPIIKTLDTGRKHITPGRHISVRNR
jgi:phage terminase large subunit GpA-like protein